METIVSFFVGMTLGGILTLGASLTGQQKQLCDALGGQYQAVGTTGESCPGGSWARLVGVRPTPR